MILVFGCPHGLSDPFPNNGGRCFPSSRRLLRGGYLADLDFALRFCAGTVALVRVISCGLVVDRALRKFSPLKEFDFVAAIVRSIEALLFAGLAGSLHPILSGYCSVCLPVS